MTNCANRETSRKLTIVEFNRRSRNWIMIFQSIRDPTNSTKINSKLFQPTMRLLSKRKCLWNLKRIDYLLNLIIYSQALNKFKRTKKKRIEEKKKLRRRPMLLLRKATRKLPLRLQVWFRNHQQPSPLKIDLIPILQSNLSQLIHVCSQ